ncbi:MAG: molybdopterin biosynthesis protein MoeA [Flavipsychrobacter sp.]|jgi:molybdopterin molybdotransferase|nr:molybdopterin biosynthesis protein MoeA [Flavipsychrobacter sp.]
MITVEEAEHIILNEIRNYDCEDVPFDHALGRILAENIVADRDLPPCNRVAMDGIAIRYSAFENGLRTFKIKGVQAAGDAPLDIAAHDECIEIMTGAALPDSVDTVVRYEDVTIDNGIAILNVETIRKGQNIHTKGKDKKSGEVVVAAGTLIDATVISMAASVGVSLLPLKKLPRVVIITTGDELVDTNAQPLSHQIRSSNNYTIEAVLQQYGLDPEMLHIADDIQATKEKIKNCLLQYDVIILCGGISMGKFDYVPQVLEELGVNKLFHRVKQRPGKPFWFGKHSNSVLVFAFPGNPVSAFMCLHRYFIPWLRSCLTPPSPFGDGRGEVFFAVLDQDVTFNPQLQYFMQVKVSISEKGQLVAIPQEGNGSGDYANLIDSNAFMELPLEKSNFKKGEVYRIWPFKQILA